MKAETHSVISNETTTLRKLGVEVQDNTKQNLACVINRIIEPNPFLSGLLIVIQFIQVIIIGIAPTIGGFLKNVNNLKFLDHLITYIIHPALLTNKTSDINFYILIVLGVIDVIWLVLFIAFIIQFNARKTFSVLAVKLIYYIGYYLLRIIGPTSISSSAYFLRCLYIEEMVDKTAHAILGIAVAICVIFIQLYMIQIISSSPDIDIKNITISWPLQKTEIFYRVCVLYFLPFATELFRDTAPQAIGTYLVNAIAAIIGIVLVYMHNSFIFTNGRTTVFSLYISLLSASLLSLIYDFIGGIEYIYIAIFIVLIIVAALLINFILNKKNRQLIDNLYLKFDDLTEAIDTPEQVIDLLHVGLIFVAPCVVNRTLQNWALSVWPTEQKMLLVIAYVYYVMNVPYRDILDILSEAVDIKPLTSMEVMLFYQIFKRLPTREVKLTRRLESVRRMYGIPKASATAFWDCIIQRQWDEAITRCYNFSDDIDKINQVFTSLIFDNPSSDTVMQEFIKFADNIQGNHIAALHAQAEINRRAYAREQQEEEKDAIQQQDQSSQVQLSKLSSIRSSVFLSEFSEAAGPADKANTNLQKAFNVRPLYWPNYFAGTIVFIALCAVAATIILYCVSKSNSEKLKTEVELASSNHVMIHKLAQALELTMRFTTCNEDEYHSITGEKIDLTATRDNLSTINHQFDQLLSDSLGMYSVLPETLRAWVDEQVSTYDAESTITADNAEEKTTYLNISLMSAIRIFQVRALTISYSPASYIGDVSNPSSDAILVGYMYPAVAEVSKVLNAHILDDITSSKKSNNKTMYMTTGILIGAGFLILIISMPLVIFGYRKEYNFFVSILQSIPPKSAFKMLTLEEQKLSSSMEARFENTSKKISSSFYGIGHMVLIYIAVFVITPIPLVIILIHFLDYQTGISFISQALQLSSSFVADFGFLCLYAYRIVSGFPSPYTKEQELSLLNGSGEQTTSNYRELFFGGTQRFPDGIIKKYPNLMDKVNSHKCTIILGEGQLNSSCMSFHDMVFFLFDQINRICSLVDSSLPTSFNTSWWRKFYPVARAALTTGIQEYYEMLTEITEDLSKTDEIYTIVSLAAGIVLFLIASIGGYCYKKYVMEPKLKNLIKPLLLMPLAVVNDCPMLLRYLQGEYDQVFRQTGRDKNRKSNENGSIPLIDFVTEGVLVVNQDGTIIGSNKKYHELMNNTAEEVLGLNVRGVLPQNVNTLFEALDTLKSGNVPQSTTAVDTLLFTEDDQEVQARVSLIIQTGEHVKQATCAFIISDRSELIKSQALLRKEKANVENLLDSILPHNIAISLLNGQADISFEAQKGLILFSDLVSFTPMCSKMSAKQIMTCLNLLFTRFDNELSKYKRVTKLKTIGDAYVCATGIFEGDGPLEAAACEIVQFAITIQRIIPQLNKQHGFTLKQRVGVHCGGPLICGVLGKEKPLFEVIGATVDLAEELEAKCLHEKVHISQPVADLITNLSIKLEERTGVKVEGIEGTTYTINP